jgi:hypothetical protein
MHKVYTLKMNDLKTELHRIVEEMRELRQHFEKKEQARNQLWMIVLAVLFVFSYMLRLFHGH